MTVIRNFVYYIFYLIVCGGVFAAKLKLERRKNCWSGHVAKYIHFLVRN